MNIEKIMAMRGAMPKSIQMDLSPKALDKWNPAIHAETADDEATITILDVIGDYWGEGVTARRISGALRSIGRDNPVTVYINSPGGDMFEGLAINSLLQDHRGKVTVKVLALAASAGSIIAMAGDEIQIARGAFFMIHNAWVIAAGNRNELREVADYLQPFDAAMADLYAERTGIDIAKISTAMDKETWIGGAEAVESGYADAVIDFKSAESSESKKAAATVRKIDLALAKTGMARSERRKLINELKTGTSGAAGEGMPGATEDGTSGAAELDVTFGLGRMSSDLLLNIS